jgi:hypothetical protein
VTRPAATLTRPAATLTRPAANATRPAAAVTRPVGDGNPLQKAHLIPERLAMQPSTPRRPGHTPSSADLPYGPLPVRTRRIALGSSGSTPLEQLVDLSWLEAEPPPPDAEVVQDEEPVANENASSDTALSMSLTTPKPETDDDVHFGVAARALGVSRKTVERMVKRGQLERGPSNAPATVSKRSLVAALEERRRDVSHLTRATEIEQAGSGTGWLSRDSPHDPASALREVLLPVLAPLLDEFVAVRTRAAVLEDQLESIMARAEQERKRDQLLFALLTSGWWARRKTRRAVLRHYIIGDDPSDPGPGAE